MIKTTQTQLNDQGLPALFQLAAAADGTIAPQALADWTQEQSSVLKAALRTAGAVLVRGCAISSPAGFREAVKVFSTDLFGYVDGNSPRRKIAAGVYTSTEYPPEYMISLHNELSYSHIWPRHLIFACISPPESGGATPLADSRTLLRKLDPALVEIFRAKGVKYIRNLRGDEGIGVSWQHTFETDDGATVEAFAAEHGMELEWKADGGLRVSQVRPAIATHPETGEEVWFNQADQFHPSTLPPEIYKSIVSLWGGQGQDFPQYACFGDGTPIDLAMFDEIRSVTEQIMVTFPWQKGDLVLVDNMLVSHGRMPFTGPRKILVSMFNQFAF